jgi:hypothetical protein
VFLVTASWRNLWNRNRLTRVACGLSAVVVFWPWLASCGLMVAWLFLPASSVQRVWAMPLYTSLGIPLVVLGLLAVCAIDLLRGAARG